MARKSRWQALPEENMAPKERIWATWAYTRLSMESERSEDSIENQLAIIQEFVGNKPDLAFRGAFKDSGFSGTNFDRPDYARMMEGIYSGEVQCVCVKDLSRLGRTYIEVGELLFDTFVRYDVRFISVNDNYDSDSEDAARKKLLILFKNLMNHMYSRDLGKKIKSSFQLKQQKGEVMGAMPPYGYVFTKEGGGKSLAIEPQSAEIVRKIFDMRLHGESANKIVEYLNRNGILPPGNHYFQLGYLSHEKFAKRSVWQTSNICAMLRKEVYTGTLIQGRYERNGKKVREKAREEWFIHENAHPAIVDKMVFDEVQRFSEARYEKYKRHGNALGENIYVGKVFCSRCGHAAKRGYYRKNKHEVKFHYYCRYCEDELRPTYTTETIRHVSLEKVEEQVLDAINVQMKVCLDIDKLLHEITASPTISGKKQLLLMEKGRIAQKEKKAADLLTAAYEHHLSGLLDTSEFALARTKFDKDRQNAIAELARIEKELAEYEVESLQKNTWLSRFRGFKGFKELDRAFVSALIERIEITPMTDDIVVTLAFQDSYGKLKAMAEESEVLALVR